MMTTEECLLGAADLIRKNGWAVGESWCSDGSIDMLGAILRSAGNDPELAVECREKVRVALKNKFYSHGSLVMYNDMNAHTKEQVIEMLETAAAL